MSDLNQTQKAFELHLRTLLSYVLHSEPDEDQVRSHLELMAESWQQLGRPLETRRLTERAVNLTLKRLSSAGGNLYSVVSKAIDLLEEYRAQSSPPNAVAASSVLLNAFRRCRRHQSQQGILKSEDPILVGFWTWLGRSDVRRAEVPFVVLQKRNRSCGFIADLLLFRFEDAARDDFPEGLATLVGNSRLYLGGAPYVGSKAELGGVIELERRQRVKRPFWWLVLLVDPPRAVPGNCTIDGGSFSLAVAVGMESINRNKPVPDTLVAAGILDTGLRAAETNTQELAAAKYHVAHKEGYGQILCALRDRVVGQTSLIPVRDLAEVQRQFARVQELAIPAWRRPRTALLFAVVLAGGVGGSILSLRHCARQEAEHRSAQQELVDYRLTDLYNRCGPSGTRSRIDCLVAANEEVRGSLAAPLDPRVWAVGVSAASREPRVLAHLEAAGGPLRLLATDAKRHHAYLGRLARSESSVPTFVTSNWDPNLAAQKDEPTLAREPDGGLRGVFTVGGAEMVFRLHGWQPPREPLRKLSAILLLDSRSGEIKNQWPVASLPEDTECLDFAAESGASPRLRFLCLARSALGQVLSAAQWEASPEQGLRRISTAEFNAKGDSAFARVFPPQSGNGRLWLVQRETPDLSWDSVAQLQQDGSEQWVVRPGEGTILTGSSGAVLLLRPPKNAAAKNARMEVRNGVKVFLVPESLGPRCAATVEDYVVCVRGTQATLFELRPDTVRLVEQLSLSAMDTGGAISPPSSSLWNVEALRADLADDRVYVLLKGPAPESPLPEEQTFPFMIASLSCDPVGLTQNWALHAPKPLLSWSGSEEGLSTTTAVLSPSERWSILHDNTFFHQFVESDRAWVHSARGVELVQLVHPDDVLLTDRRKPVSDSSDDLVDGSARPRNWTIARNGRAIWLLRTDGRFEVRERLDQAPNRVRADTSPLPAISVSPQGSKALVATCAGVDVLERKGNLIERTWQEQSWSCAAAGFVSWTDEQPSLVTECRTPTQASQARFTTVGAKGGIRSLVVPLHPQERAIVSWREVVLGVVGSTNQNNRLVLQPSARSLLDASWLWSRPDLACEVETGDLGAVAKARVLAAQSDSGESLLFGLLGCGWLASDQPQAWKLVRIPVNSRVEPEDRSPSDTKCPAWSGGAAGSRWALGPERALLGPSRGQVCAYRLAEGKYQTPGCFGSQGWRPIRSTGLESFGFDGDRIHEVSDRGYVQVHLFPPTDNVSFASWLSAELNGMERQLPAAKWGLGALEPSR